MPRMNSIVSMRLRRSGPEPRDRATSEASSPISVCVLADFVGLRGSVRVFTAALSAAHVGGPMSLGHIKFIRSCSDLARFGDWQQHEPSLGTYSKHALT